MSCNYKEFLTTGDSNMDKHIIFKGNKISRTVVKNNILRTYSKATPADKVDWYVEANNFCQYVSEHYELPLNKVIGIVSALSPRKSWELNKRVAVDLITKNEAGHMQVFVDKARDIRDNGNTDEEILSILNGTKIKSFYLNIKYPKRDKTVTIDRHAIAVALGRTASDLELAITPKHYKFFEDCYKWTAEKVGISPVQLQAVTWTTWRKLK